MAYLDLIWARCKGQGQGQGQDKGHAHFDKMNILKMLTEKLILFPSNRKSHICFPFALNLDKF